MTDFRINQLDKVALMLYQLGEEDSPLLNNYNLTFLAESNELENLFQDLLDKRSLDTAEGVQLDQIGWLLGEDRLNREDEAYLRAIKTRLAINTSTGTIEDINSVISLVFGEEVKFLVKRSGDAAVSVFIGMPAVPSNLRSLLEQTVAAGVGIGDLVTYSGSLPWIPTERGAIDNASGILPERGDTSDDIVVPPERLLT